MTEGSPNPIWGPAPYFNAGVTPEKPRCWSNLGFICFIPPPPFPQLPPCRERMLSVLPSIPTA